MQKGIPPKIVRMWAAQVPALAAIRKEMETMLSFKLIVTLAVVVFMTISLVIHKVPYGITGMTCVSSWPLQALWMPKAHSPASPTPL